MAGHLLKQGSFYLGRYSGPSQIPTSPELNSVTTEAREEGGSSPTAFGAQRDNSDEGNDEFDDADHTLLRPHVSMGDGYRGEALPPGWFTWRKLWAFTGPGFLMSIAYIDPGNLESDLQAGAHAGYSLLWMFMWSTMMGYIMQMLAAKLGVATGKHLAEHCRAEYPAVPRYALWVMAEIAIIGSDIQEVIGCAIAITLLSQGYIPIWMGVIITAVDAFLFLFLERLGIRNLEAFFGLLIGVMSVSFGYMYVEAGVHISDVAYGLLIPQLPRSAVNMAVGILGAVIMPHNIYLHSALVQSRKLANVAVGLKKEGMLFFGIESGAALLVSLFINICVVTVFAKGFYGKDIGDIGLENAGKYLGDRFGSSMGYVWALGLLAAGQSATMTGTYTGQFVMAGFLDLKVSAWSRVVITRSVALAPTLLVAIISRVPNQLDHLNQWLNILQSIQLPFAVIPVLMMTSNRRIMGAAFVNSKATQVAAWTIAALIIAVNGYLTYVFANENLLESPISIAGLCVTVVLYLIFVSYLVVGPERYSAIMDNLRHGSKGASDNIVESSSERGTDPLLEAGQSSSSFQSSQTER